MQRKRRGVVFTISAPSGCGKTTVAVRVKEELSGVVRSVSANTRKIRPGEIEGVDYYFISTQEFETLKEQGEFIEYTEVYNTKRGTLKAPLLQNINDGIDTICAIERQGMKRLKEIIPQDVVSIFLLPPSIEELTKRLIGRGQDSTEQINLRLTQAKSEIKFASDYDYQVFNDDLEECVKSVKCIFEAERLKTCRFMYNVNYNQEYYI